MIHLLDDALLYLLRQNVLVQYGNNPNVFCCNNLNALFQYRPTLVKWICCDINISKHCYSTDLDAINN